MKTPEYNKLVLQTYVDPIRSVVMIDDNFPMYTELLEQCDRGLQPNFPSSTKTYLKILCDLCKEHRWTYHIENKLPDDSVEPAYNADLIFLDFKFGEGDDGERAINTIKHYCFSKRFNFFVIYTEDSAQKVFSKIVESLGYRSAESNDAAEEKILEIDIDHPGFSGEILSIAQDNYYEYIIDLKNGKKIIFDQIKLKLEAIGINCGKTACQCTQWAIARVASLSTNKSLNIPIEGKFSIDCNWLQIGYLFLTVITKNISLSSTDLLNKIIASVYAWHPSPGQLIMKDAKNQIDDFCVLDLFPSVKQEIAWFYFTYISDKKFMSSNDILNNLMDLVKDNLKNRLHDNFCELTPARQIQDFYPANNSTNEDLVLDINIYNSTLPLKEPTHISTGMIFKDNANESSYWICMTQACDLVPSQNSLKWVIGDFKPITFVKLYSQKRDNALSNATRGNTVFFEDGKDKKHLCIFSNASEDRISNPHYETFFVPQKGKITSPADIKIYKIAHDPLTQKLVFLEHSFSVVTQLRQEYASMLLQKISNHKARIPVNYINKEIAPLS